MKKFYFSLFLLFTFVLTAKIFGIQFNYTDSMPIGFYKSVNAKTIHRGDLVAVCLPKHIAVEGLKRHYLKSGSCSSGVVPVLKKVIAAPGDTVDLSKQFITVNDLMYSAPLQLKDHLQKPVKQFVKNGSFKRIKTFWLYGANDPVHSWDSRYYGGVLQTNIVGVYKPYLVV